MLTEGANSNDAVNQPGAPFLLTMKFDQMRHSLQFRVALFLYLILTEMIGGTVKPDRDIQLKGIEGLISAQMMSIKSNSEKR